MKKYISFIIISGLLLSCGKNSGGNEQNGQRENRQKKNEQREHSLVKTYKLFKALKHFKNEHREQNGQKKRFGWVDTGFLLYNEEGKFYDVSEVIHNIPKAMFEVTEFYHIEKKTYVPISGDVSVDFAIGNDEDIQKYSSDSLNSRLKYRFIIPTPVLPTIKLNSFSYTDKNGNIIPSILYYKTEGEVLGIIKVGDISWEETDIIINIIDSLPVIFTNRIKKDMENMTFEIFAECSQSYVSIDTVYINYDIEVGNKRFIKQCKYSKKQYWDRRPKFW